MKYVLRLCVLAAAMVMAIPSQAKAADMDGGFDTGSGIKPYIGVGFGVYDLNYANAGLGLTQRNDAVGGFLRLGWDFNDYFGFELRAAGTDKAETKYGVAGLPPGWYWYIDQRASYMFSYLAKIQYPATQEFSIYGLVGGTTGMVDVRGASQYAGKIGTGVSYGAGFDYKVDNFMSVGLEYMSLWTGVNPVKSAFLPPGKEDVSSYTATLRIMM